MRLQQTVERTGRKVERFLLRFFRFHFGEKGGCSRFRCGSGRIGGNFRLCFGSPCFLLRCGFHARDMLPFLLMLCRQPAKLLASLRREVHHHFIEAVDGRVGIPIQSGVNIIRIGFGCDTHRLCFLAVPVLRRWCGRRLWRCGRNLRRNLRLRFGRHTSCRAFLFRRLFLLGGCFLLAYLLGHAPEVEQGELHALRIIGTVRLYLRLFFLRLRCYRFGLGCHFITWLYLRSDNWYGNGFRNRAFPLCRMQAVHFIQFFVKLMQLDFQMFPQVLRHLPDAAPVQELIGRFPVRVCASD